MGEVTDQSQGHEDKLDRSESEDKAVATSQAAPTSVEPVTPQDSQAAGAGSAAQIEHLKGNVSGSEQKGAAEKAAELVDEGGEAGYHSTGSFTGTSGGQ